jgi:tetratricopeptide (TPR) repeat protein
MRAALALVLISSLARAETAEDALARAHYQRAQASFDQARYADALHEYEEAFRLTPYPAILYRIGLCKEQVGDYAGAADSLEDYLRRDPESTRREAVQASIARLRERAQQPEASAPSPPPVEKPAAPLALTAPPPPARSPRRWLVPGLMLGAAAGLAIVGAGLIGSVASDFDGCARPCSDGAIASMQNRAYSSYALFGLAGAVAIVDVALWVLVARSRR